MRDTLVVTLVGNDRTGLVESLARQIAAVGGNWEDSKMARLAGQFAGILLVTVEKARTDELVAALRSASDLVVTIRPATPAERPPSRAAKLQVRGNDRSGLVRDVARVLAEASVNLDELESGIVSAPMSGEPMFSARAKLHVPAGVSLDELRHKLESLGADLMVDLE